MSAAAAIRQSSRQGLQLDPLLLGIVLCILLLGLVSMTSASIPIASQAGDPFAYLKDQIAVAGAGLLLALVLCAIPTDLYQKYSSVLLVVAAVLLVAVLIPGIGHEVKGGRRWLRLAGFNLQASEVARVLVLCWVAAYAVRRETELRETLGGLLRPLGITSLFCVLLLAEPDFGAASVLFATAFGLLFLAGARLRWVMLCLVVAGAVFSLLMMAAPYRVRRITAFLDPWAHAYDSGFQLTQSLMAIGRGQWFGVGIGESVLKLEYLPEAHTDFLFSVMAEELGLVAVVLTLALFLALVWRVMALARQAALAGLRFQACLAAGFGLWVGIQSMINIGVTMSVLPTKGLTLPFMSYGRSSLLVALVWFGMVMRVHHEVASRTRGPASTGSRRVAREQPA